MDNTHEIPKYAEAEASISMRKVEWISLFKRRYTWLMLFRGDYWREITTEEKERGIYPGRTVWDSLDLNEMFPIFGEVPRPKKQAHVTPKWVKDKKLYMGVFEVSRKDYRKYRKAKRVVIKFELKHYKNIRILKSIE
jgi:murein L,D-transpeptidase YafK